MLRPVWNEKCSVNVRVLDEQHKRFFEILGNLYDSRGRVSDPQFLGARVWELAMYAVTHFDTEELMMSEYSFSGYEEHRKEHESFKEKVAIFKKDLEMGQTSLALDMITFLTGWLEHHILNVDQQYSLFLNGKGIR
ncbi:MAG: bacteriohemerythrin [Candidatus Omnitrophota bacterium]